MMKKVAIGSGLLLLILGGILYYMNYDFRAGIARERPDFVVDAKALFAEYERDEEAANQKYLGKILEVDGIVKSIDKNADPITVVLETEALMGNLVCELSKAVEIDIDQIVEGESVTIKGSCSGKLLDVILVNCITVKL